MVTIRTTFVFTLLALIAACGVKAPPSPLYHIPITDPGVKESGETPFNAKTEATPSPSPSPSPDRTNTKKKKK